MYMELTEDALGTLLANNQKVMVQFGATWCGNCRIMKPKFKKLGSEHEDITFVYVDAEKYPAARQFATVDNLPTFAAFKNGQLVNQVQTNQFDSLKTLCDEIAGN
jgi:thiol-disulfide isomerase/thioredoxin